MKKKWMTSILAVALLVTMAGCGGGEAGRAQGVSEPSQAASNESKTESGGAADQGQDSADSKSGKKTVAISVMFSHPYFDAITEGIEEVMGPEGYSIVSQAGENDVQKQISDIEDFCAQGVDAIFVEPFDWKAIKPGLEAAQKAGIPIMCVDAPCYDEELVLANVQSDNYGAGVAAAEDAIKKTAGKGNVVVLDCPTTKTCLDRADGFVETIAAEEGMKIVAQQNSDMAQDVALEAMENILQANNDIQVVFAVNEEAAMGAITAIESAGLTVGGDGILVYSVNGASMEVEMINAGKMIATSAQQPKQLGLIGGGLMLDYLQDGTVPEEKNVYVDIIFVDKNTVKDYTPVY